MPQATLTFNLPEESAEHQTAIDGQKWKNIICDVLNNFRHDLKYDANITPTQARVLEKMREYIHQRMTEENLSIYD